MSIMPNAGSRSGMPQTVRNLMFWMLMILLAVMLWQMASRNGNSNTATRTFSYSDFMAQVDAKNVQAARFALSQNTAEVTGNLKQPAEHYTTNVPKDSATSLMNTLRSEGTEVEVAERSTTASRLVDFAPIVILIVVWIYMSQTRRRRDAGPPNQASPGALG